MTGRLLNASLVERISRLEMQLHEIWELLKALGLDQRRPSGGGLSRRDCDLSAFVRTGPESVEQTVFHPQWVASETNEQCLCFFNGSHVCGIMYAKEDGSISLRCIDWKRERDALQVATDRIGMKPVAETFVEDPIGTVVVGRDGTLGLQASSEARKERIRPLEGCLSLVRRVEPVRFRWRSSKNEDIGFIDEELQEGIGVRTFELLALIAILWGAVRELSEKIGLEEEDGSQ